MLGNCLTEHYAETVDHFFNGHLLTLGHTLFSLKVKLIRWRWRNLFLHALIFYIYIIYIYFYILGRFLLNGLRLLLDGCRKVKADRRILIV